MENDQATDPGIPVIEKKGAGGKSFVSWQGKEFGPWDQLDSEMEFSHDRKHWAIRGELHHRPYVLIDGIKFGPFDYFNSRPWFDPGRNAFVFTTTRGGEFYLIADGKIVKKGKIVEKINGETFLMINGRRFGPFQDVDRAEFSLSGKKWAAEVRREDRSWLLLNGKEYGPFRQLEWLKFSMGAEMCTCRCHNDQGKGLLINGEHFFGPYESIFGPFFSPDGKRWGMDIEKKKWRGFIVEGIEYGPFPFQYFIPRFSDDSRHWVVILNGGHEDSPHSFILDGIKYGPFKINDIGFMADNRFICIYRWRGRYFILLDGRRIGPYCHEAKDIIHLDGAVLADMTFVKKGKKTVRRCVISCQPEESERRIFFSPKSGDSFAEAIEIINAADHEEGVAAECAYLRLKYQSLGKTFSMVEQHRIPRGAKHYDKLIIELENGQREDYYFNITSFFEKSSEKLSKCSVEETRCKTDLLDK